MKVPSRMWLLLLAVVGACAAFVLFGPPSARLSAAISAIEPKTYEPPPESTEVKHTGHDSPARPETCAGIDLSGTSTIVLPTDTAVYYGPDSADTTNFTLPAGSSYRLLGSQDVSTFDPATGNTVTVTWYEIDGPCPGGSGSTLWFPAPTPFTVVAAGT